MYIFNCIYRIQIISKKFGTKIDGKISEKIGEKLAKKQWKIGEKSVQTSLKIQWEKISANIVKNSVENRWKNQ